MEQRPFQKPVGELKDRVIFVNRVTKVVAGGKRLRFTALVVVGDENGHVGFGKGKAREVPMAIQKAIKRAKKNLIEVPRVGTTIPHEVIGRHDAGRVLLKPASRGTGVIAGGPVRAVMELAGIRDVLTKSMRSNNPFAVIRATFDALMKLRSPEQIAQLRGKPLSSFYRNPFAEEDIATVPEEAPAAAESAPPSGSAAEAGATVQPAAEETREMKAPAEPAPETEPSEQVEPSATDAAAAATGSAAEETEPAAETPPEAAVPASAPEEQEKTRETPEDTG